MNPQPPHNETANYPRDPMNGEPAGPFKGDKIFVILDVLLFLIGFGFMFAMMPTMMDEAMKNQPTTGPKTDPAMMQNIMYGSIACMGIVCLPISIFVWINIVKGRQWAFIVMLVLAILGVLGNVTSLGGPAAGFAIGSMLLSLAKVVYGIMRMTGKVGPSLR